MNMSANMSDSFFSGKQALITGAAGFIGSHLSQALLSAGSTVTGVDNFLTGQREHLPALSQHPNFHFIEADVTTSPATYLPVDYRPDFILHFASPASPPRYQAHPVETYLVNSYGTHVLLSYLKEVNPAGRFVFAGTSEAYGDPAVHPQTESYWGNVNPNGPRSCYDEAKRLGETICGVFARDFNMDTRIVRIFNTYGPQMDPADGRVIPNLLSQALAHQPITIYGDGSQTRSYCFVSDLVAGILAMASTENLKGETINLGNPQERTILETAQVIAQVLRSIPEYADFALQLEYKPLPKDDPTRRRPDITKAQQLLAWTPQIDFETGLKQTIPYFQSVLKK
jgi:nucleoside-diphosphate-sugar epimerase